MDRGEWPSMDDEEVGRNLDGRASRASNRFRPKQRRQPAVRPRYPKGAVTAKANPEQECGSAVRSAVAIEMPCLCVRCPQYRWARTALQPVCSCSASRRGRRTKAAGGTDARRRARRRAKGERRLVRPARAAGKCRSTRRARSGADWLSVRTARMGARACEEERKGLHRAELPTNGHWLWREGPLNALKTSLQ